MLAVRINNRTIRLEPMHPDLAYIKRRRRQVQFAENVLMGTVLAFGLTGVIALLYTMINL